MPGPVTSSSPRAYDLNPVSPAGTDAPECKLSDSASASEPLADAGAVSQLTDKYRQGYSAFLTAQTQTPTPASAATVDNTRRELPTAITYAELAHAAYGSAAVPGWHRLDAAELEAAGLDPGAFRDESSGFKASLFQEQATGEFVLAFAGTEDWTDWKTNLGQGAGDLDDQYRQAIDLAVSVTDAVGQTKMVGHSLGGGLAAAAAIGTRSEAVTFNAAGLHANTIAYATPGADVSVEPPWSPGGTTGGPLALVGDRYEESKARESTALHVTNYRTSGELLTSLQTIIPDAPSAQGRQIDVARADESYSLWSAMDRVRLHAVDQSIDALRGRELQEGAP